MKSDPTSEKILARDAMIARRAELAEQGKTVVQCHGCFDIVHPGHVRYLRFAATLGDVLVVSITGDRHITKGADRPYIHQDLRLENLAVLEFVDYVCVEDDHGADQLLRDLKPDVYVKGKEYETKIDPRFTAEREIVESYGGQVVFSSGDVVFSSTHLLEGLRGALPMELERIRFFCREHAIDRPAVEAAIDSYRNKKVLLVGDAILDQYIHCGEMQIASESPVPSVSPVTESWYVGGVAVIARQMANLGARPTVLTTLDDSEAARRYRTMLEDNGVEVEALDTRLRPVFVKARYLVEGQKVFKVNHGRRAPLPADLSSSLKRRLDDLHASFDALLVADFGYGLFGERLIGALNDLAQLHRTPLFVDVSGSGVTNLLKFEYAALASPTERELRFAMGDADSGLSNLAARFYAQTGTRRLVLTLGARGAIHFSRPPQEGQPLIADYLPAFNSHPRDDVGAGDVFLCHLVLSSIAEMSPQMGLYLASLGASLHIGLLGNEPAGLHDLFSYLGQRPELES